MRDAGILLPIFSLPSKYGIGCFSKEAYEFIDFLANANQKYWQILPLTPTDNEGSPYASCSAFAGNINFIDVSRFTSGEILNSLDWGDNPHCIDYEKVKTNKIKLIRMFYENQYKNELEQDDYYIEFYNHHKFWLDGYADYIAKKENEEVEFIKFQQFLFYHQWNEIKRYANHKGIEIIGDMPIYVSLDSSDVVDNEELFQLENGKPKAVAGCPPDAFSDEGQLWGNPLYDWNKHKETKYKWWIERIKHNLELYDVVRIDHFRGMYDYYSIPYGDKNARNGHWELGAGLDLFNTVKEVLGNVRLIAEDLGYLSPGVHDLLNATGYPGMKILQFAFNGEKDNPYLPENLGTDNCIIYTGTHDNDTTVGWWNKATDWERQHFREYSNNENPCWGLIELAMSTRANTCIIPIQDYLELDSFARINTPGTVGCNWKWKLTEIPSNELANRIKNLTIKYNRH